MSAKNEGPECQQKHTAALLKPPKHDSKITFFDQNGDEVGILDFNGPGLAFEGIADQSAIEFMDYVSKIFQQRLKDEYKKGYKEGKASQAPQ
jgi:hypothetical protein